MTIGELAKRAGVKVTTLRYYERRGLLSLARRSPSGYRLYSPDVVERIVFIRRAQGLGFSLREIAELLRLRQATGNPRPQAREWVQGKPRGVEGKLHFFRGIKRGLEELLSACEEGDVSGACPILGPLEGGDREMRGKRMVEVFSAGCPICERFIESIRQTARPRCEIRALDMGDPTVAERAKSLGIRSLPAVVIDGELAPCCIASGPDPRSLGLGQKGT